MKIRKMFACFCSAMIFTQSIPFFASAKEYGMWDITTMELVRDMGLGINLGNTYESCGDWIS